MKLKLLSFYSYTVSVNTSDYLFILKRVVGQVGKDKNVSEKDNLVYRLDTTDLSLN